MIEIVDIIESSEDIEQTIILRFETEKDIESFMYKKFMHNESNHSYIEDNVNATYTKKIVKYPHEHIFHMDNCTMVKMIEKMFDNYNEILTKHKLCRECNLKAFCMKTREDAVIPYKTNTIDSGFDVTLIDVSKKIGNVTLFNTGIKIKPPYGYYFDLVPRSSIIKTGYMLANSVGIIDFEYRGEILVPLIKVDPEAKDIELPARIAQLILRKLYLPLIEQVETLDETTRNEGGFGSTG